MNNVLLEGLTPLLVDAFIVVVGAIIAAVGVELRKVQKANADDTRFAFLQRVAEVGVQAAEQLYGEFAGDAKREYALDYVESKLAEAGIKVETDLIVAQIEAAVLREFNFPAVEPTAPQGEEVSTPVDPVDAVTEREFNTTDEA